MSSLNVSSKCLEHMNRTFPENFMNDPLKYQLNVSLKRSPNTFEI